MVIFIFLGHFVFTNLFVGNIIMVSNLHELGGGGGGGMEETFGLTPVEEETTTVHDDCYLPLPIYIY